MASGQADRKHEITRGTRNVFADLGCADAAERQAKMRFAYAVNRVLEHRNLNAADAAKMLAIPRRVVCELQGYHLDGFSVNRLATLLATLTPSADVTTQTE